MKRSNRFKAIIAALVLFTLIPMTVLPSSATPASPPTLLDGSDVSGVVIPKESGIIIENQSITFYLTDFPNVTDTEITKDYNASVKTEYTLYNPTDSEITLKFAYYLPKAPYYFSGNSNTAEVSKYSVMINGEPAETALRHGINYGDVDPYTKFLSLISDDYISNEYCGPDMTVTKYIFKQSDVNGDDPFIGFDVNESELTGSCIYFGEYSHAYNQKDGDLRFNKRAGENGSTFELYVFGRDLTRLPDWKIYKDGGVEDGEEIGGKIEFVSKETTTFLEYVSERYDSSLGINELDWFNMAATEISIALEGRRIFTLLESINGDLSYYLESGLTYEITLAPGERAVNTQNAPVYPSVEMKYEPNTYIYNYLLSTDNAELFTGKINVNINTPYYILDDTGSFEKTENGYGLTLDPIEKLSENSSVTHGAIRFTLCEVEEPEEVESGSSGWIIIIILAMLIIMPFLLIKEAVSFVVNGVKSIIQKLKG